MIGHYTIALVLVLPLSVNREPRSKKKPGNFHNGDGRFGHLGPDLRSPPKGLITWRKVVPGIVVVKLYLDTVSIHKHALPSSRVLN